MMTMIWYFELNISLALTHIYICTTTLQLASMQPSSCNYAQASFTIRQLRPKTPFGRCNVAKSSGNDEKNLLVISQNSK